MSASELLVLLLPYMGSLVVSFFDATIKTFQSRNIAIGNERAAFYTSILVSSLTIANFKFFLMGGWWILIPLAIGGSTGVVTAMRLHKRIFKVGQ